MYLFQNETRTAADRLPDVEGGGAGAQHETPQQPEPPLNDEPDVDSLIIVKE